MNVKKWIQNLAVKSLLTITGSQQIRFNEQGKPEFWTLNSVFGINKPSTHDLLNNAYGRNPYVANIINNIASGATSLDREIKKDDEIIEDDDLKSLLEQPNPRDTNKEFYQRIFTNLLIKEVFICGIKPLGMSRYGELIVPNIDNVHINTSGTGKILSYHVSYFNTLFKFLPKDVLHIYNPDVTFDNDRGYSRLDSNVDVWQTNNEVWQSEKHLHRNKGVSGIIHSKGGRNMTPTERLAMQKQYDSETTGMAFGSVRVERTQLGFLKMGMNPADLKSIEARLDHLRTLCAAYNIDSVLMGDVAGTTFNNKTEAGKQRIKQAVLPIATWVDRVLSKWLINDNFALSDTAIEINKDKIEILQSINAELSTKILSEVKAGILSREQGFEILYPELEISEAVAITTGEGDILEEDPEAEDANALAQANLRGSVGGVQGILAIQQSVAAGTTSNSAAIATLVEIYGFDRPTARVILGIKSLDGKIIPVPSSIIKLAEVYGYDISTAKVILGV